MNSCGFIWLDIGCWFSINPAMVKSKTGIRIIQEIPKGLIVPETDSPFTGEYGNTFMPWDVELVYWAFKNMGNFDK